MKKQLFVSILLVIVNCCVGFSQTYNRYNTEPDPFDVQIRVYKAAIRYYDLQAATTAIYKMMALKPERKDLNDSLALLYFAGERYAQANLVGEQILKTNPRSKNMLEIVAISKQNLGMVKESLADYEKLYASEKSLFYLYQIATLQYQLKRYSEAIVSLNTIIGDYDSQKQKVSITASDSSKYQVNMKAAALNVKGICNLEMDDKKAARENFELALQIEPEFPLAKGNLEELDGRPYRSDRNETVYSESKSVSNNGKNIIPVAEVDKKEDVGTGPPPLLAIKGNSITFEDENGMNDINAFENSRIHLEIKNTGKGDGYGLSVNLSAKGTTSGINYNPTTRIPVIKSGDSYKAEIPINANGYTENGSINFTIQVDEPHGLGSDPVDIEISTKAFISPLVKVVDYSVTGASSSNLARKQPFDLQVLVQNTKQGTAENVTAEIKIPENILLISGEHYTSIGTLKAGATKEILYSLIVTDHYTSNSIPLSIQLKERYGKYAEDKTITLNLNQALSTNKIVVTASADNSPPVNIKEASLSSDVDKNIPETAITKANTYALIIGNEDYSSFQMGLSKEVNADYALNDARIFKEYCNKTLGVPERQIKLLSNATAGQMNQGIAWLANLAKVDNGKAELIVYYSGHGLPDEQTKEPYLIPVDVSGSNVTQGIRLNDVYTKLNENPAQKVTVFLDACFSGGARNQGLVAMKGVKIKPKENLLNGNVVVFTSSSGEESSGVYREKQHGYMTYYLLKKLQETKGDISYSQLANYITETVKKETALTGKIQTPQVNYSSSVDGIWSGWKLK